MSDDALLDGIVTYLKSVIYPERRLEKLIEMNTNISSKVWALVRKEMKFETKRTDDQDSEVTRV